MKQLKKICTAFLMVVFTISTVNSQNNFHNRHILDPYNPEYVKGEVLVKFKDEVVVEAKAEAKAKDEVKVTTGIKSVDEFLKDKQAKDIEKVFKETRESSRAKSRGATRYFTDFKGQRHEVPKLYNIYKFKFDEVEDAKELAELLSQNTEVDYAEPNYLIYSMNTYPNDALYQSGEQWYIDAINAPAAWDSVTCDTTQIIGIIDTGIDWDHPDLDGNIWRNWGELPDNGLDDDGNGFIDDVRGWDFTSNSNDPDDDNGHGTHVAGVVAAETDNYVGIAGIAWNARIMPIKVLTGTGHGNTAWLASAIYYAANNGATVINMSLGTYGESQTVKDALLFAYDTLTIVGAAGNDNLKVDTIAPPNQAYGPMFPGCYPFVIGVEAATQAGTLAGFSNFDPSGFSETANPDGFNYEIIAPGVNIFSTFPGGGYRSLSGTSMASPIVAGAVALIKDFELGISNEEIFARLIQFAQAGHLKIPNILHGRLESDVFYVNHALIDTVGDADNDGHADSDEAFDMWFTVKNAGGYADSVWAKLRLDYLGDTALVSIIDSTSYIGNMDSAGFHNEIPAYTTLTGESDPFRVYIKPGVINEKDIVFEYEIGAKNGSSETGNFYLTIQNGEELKGILDSTFTLTPDKLWLVNQSFKIIESGKLIIKPGTHLKIDKRFVIKGEIEGHGTRDSLIYIQGPESFEGANVIPTSFKYTKFYDFDQYFEGTHHFDHCIFEDFRNNYMF
jgi:subtilisin family serine protease